MNTNYLNMSDNIEIVGEVEARSEQEKKQEKMIEYIRSLRALEDAMEPIRSKSVNSRQNLRSRAGSPQRRSA